MVGATIKSTSDYFNFTENRRGFIRVGVESQSSINRSPCFSVILRLVDHLACRGVDIFVVAISININEIYVVFLNTVIQNKFISGLKNRINIRIFKINRTKCNVVNQVANATLTWYD